MAVRLDFLLALRTLIDGEIAAEQARGAATQLEKEVVKLAGQMKSQAKESQQPSE